MTSRVERAAGGLVFRNTSRGLEVLMIHDAYGKITFPKGHLEPGESFEDAALREVEEETGIKSRLIAPLGRVEYPVVRDGEQIRKVVRFYLLEAIDEQDEPRYQAEEIKDAMYIHLEEARRLHDKSGYANWSWVFDKAKALWDWHEEKWDSKWRGLEAKVDQTEVVKEWNAVEPLVRRLIDAVYRELTITASETVMDWNNETDQVHFPLDNIFRTDDIRQAIEHTRLNPEASEVDIENLCFQAKKNNFALVCVPPRHVAIASKALTGTNIRVCTVLGFPHGANTPHVLCEEMRAAVQDGASDVDMVIPIGAMCEDDIYTVYRFVREVVSQARSMSQKPCVKVILETSTLKFDQVIKASMVSIAAGADFIKTSTGFHKRGAAIADVAVMRMIAGHNHGVKASGGVRTKEEALLFLRFGASRIGTSSGASMVR